MRRSDNELPLVVTVDDETYDELMTLVGQRIVHIGLWEDSLSVALAEHAGESLGPAAFDIDLYLEDGVYFELYGVSCFDDLEAEPWSDPTESLNRLVGMVKAQACLGDVAVDEMDSLILILSTAAGETVYLAVSAWLLAEWDELPE
ncbi:MAG: hypothetical protein NZ553_01845 [Caldilinea sp.]|nr:hypothetical protein [Caldilinea sp.]MDW8439193.1 hypothetical protein [Caldilineaceae bacterium]